VAAPLGPLPHRRHSLQIHSAVSHNLELSFPLCTLRNIDFCTAPHGQCLKSYSVLSIQLNIVHKAAYWKFSLNVHTQSGLCCVIFHK